MVINFIFTSCSDSCPLETARLRQVQKLLGDRVGKDVFFYSISIDPLSDTPAVLKAYARRFQVGPGWQFLTGEFADVTELRQKLGLFIEGVDNGRSKDHNLSLIVGNQQTGRWMKASPFENPWILADQLANTLQNWKQPSIRAELRRRPAHPAAEQWRRTVSHPLRVVSQPWPAGRAGHRHAQHWPRSGRRDPTT